MKNAENFGRKAIVILYVLGVLGMLGILVIIHFTKDYEEDTGFTDYVNISGEWSLDEAGMQAADLNKLGEYMDEETGILSIYYKLPHMDGDKSLVYRTKDVYTKLLIGNEVIYETTVPESRLYNHSPGNLWNVVTLRSKYSEALVEMQIYMVYNKNAVTVDTVMWGNETDIILGFCRDKLFGIWVSVLMILIGIVLILYDIMPAHGQLRKNHSMLWLGLYSVLTGIWSLIETNVMQFTVSDMRILQLVDNMVMIMDSLPLLIYMDCEYQVFKNRFMRVLGYANVVFILSSVMIQFTGVIDIHYMLPGAMLTFVVFDITLFVWGLLKLKQMMKKHQSVLNCALQFLGLCFLWLSGLCEMGRYMQSDHMDRAEYIRVGILLFIIFFSISGQIETYRLLKNGLKFDIISNLAYSDGLTGLGNRTAYLEQLEKYADGEAGTEQLGIVFLDVNNLKKVNDNQGHEKGDELIMIASRIISDSFGKFGKAYRIGGDEFCVLMTGLALQEQYEKGLTEFKKLIDEANKAKWYTYEIQIANGFSICDALDKRRIDETIMSADSAMYADKNLLKACNRKL